jgi:tyrosyl-tRNA synthetase
VLTTPILEGLDGVQKMSKSLGNAIGIDEPPLEMFGKVMSISDAMMWRYWELLTDTSMAGIEALQQQVKSGQAHPMKMKQGLATKIVADFHGEAAAKKAQEDWSNQFQKGGVPEDVETVSVKYDEVAAKAGDGKAVKLDKLLARCGLADSATDGQRKLKQNAVRVNGEVRTDPVLPVAPPAELTLRVGRLLRKVRIEP